MGTIIIAGTGLSLTQAVVAACIDRPVIAINDAHLVFPGAVALYAADFTWWRMHAGVPAFNGRKVTCVADVNGAADVAQLAAWGVESVALDHGSSSLYGAISLARLMGFARIVLVGADMRATHPRHFFGDHPPGLRNTGDYRELRLELEALAARMPPGLQIFNATPNSALTAFPFAKLDQL